MPAYRASGDGERRAAPASSGDRSRRRGHRSGEERLVGHAKLDALPGEPEQLPAATVAPHQPILGFFQRCGGGDQYSIVVFGDQAGQGTVTSIRIGDFEVTTTDSHLARGIAEAIHDAYKGELKVRYSRDENLVRAVWKR